MKAERTNGRKRPAFTDILLAGIVLLMLTGAGVSLTLYSLPSHHLQAIELQPAMRISRESEFPVGASRLVHWGERVVLIIRRTRTQYYALQGTAPNNGCLLQWDRQSLRVVSPCSYLVYDLGGSVVNGLMSTPLQRYDVFERSGVIYLTETSR